MDKANNPLNGIQVQPIFIYFMTLNQDDKKTLVFLLMSFSKETKLN